ncbi:LLM class flavin-dependent oxidoreductase [Sphingomonas montanisoli]|uniref:LLM class flavin-dependent oxidoreductase n=2 Tax=Sphingomonas montanisoli TaxID=2606412 RepID=A0A5D9CBF0_9SPHN|nr:LLM class flavin-dependent oxidoreductase [Sphingomonas montanisoli]
MRFHCSEAMTAIDNYIPLAKAVEEAGYAGFLVPDSLIYPQASDTEYLYNSDGSRDFLENKPFVETFILASAILTATSRLEVTSNVVKLPVRQPLYSAKLACSVDALSGGRFNFGVGLSVWPDDYQAMGVDYAKRGKRLDECIAIVRGLATGDYFAFHGEFYDMQSVKINPVARRPLPILVGGHSDPALRRAALHDGFIYAGGALDDFVALIEKLRSYRAEAGTADTPYRIFARTYDAVTPDYVRRMEDLGVTDMPVAFRNMYANEEDTQPIDEKIADYVRFADEVMAKL